MADGELIWGVPADAPPPQPKIGWGKPADNSAPVGRDGTASAEADADGAATPQWAPIAEVSDLVAHPAGITPFDPFADPADDSVDAVADTGPAEEPADVSGVHPDSGELAADPDRDAPVTADAVAPGPEEPALADGLAEDAELLPEPVTAATPANFSLPAAFTADAPADADGDDLAAMFDTDPSQADAATATPAGDDQAPVPVDGTAAAPAPAGEPDDLAQAFTSREDALAAWRTMQQRRTETHDQQPQETTAVSAHAEALAYRYRSADRLTDIVDRILALAQTGDPQVQAVINGFELTRDPDRDAEQRRTYEKLMLPLMQANYVSVDNPQDHQTVFDLAYDELIGIGPLGPLWRDDDVTEIIVSGPHKVTAERNGRLMPTPARFRDLDHLKRTARDLAQRVDDRVVARTNPLVTAQLPGARVQFALAPVAPVAGVSITIRKFRPLFGLPDLLRFGALTEEMATFLDDAVRARATILVSGGTGSGKTTMINALSSFIPDTERVITIEDALELKLTNTHVESLLTKEAASGDDQVRIGQDELLRASLRMRPDRIIVGEIRDGKGCATMLQAANTGHDGTMTTVHANNPHLALRRLAQLLRSTETMTDEVAREEVTNAFDIIVQVVRARGRRFVSNIAVVNGGEDDCDTTDLFVGEYPSGAEHPVFRRAHSLGADTDLAQRMADAGLDPSIWR